MSDDVGGPFVVWVNYGYEGWQPTSYPTLAAAIEHDNYGSQMTITRPVSWVAVETTDNPHAEAKLVPVPS